MLFARRKRLEQIAAAEADGHVFWSQDFDEASRTRLFHFFRECGGNWAYDIAEQARKLVLLDEGRMFLMRSDLDPADDLLNFLLHGDDVPTCLEAMVKAVRSFQHKDSSMWERPRHFESLVSLVLREHRISFELVDGVMIEFESQALHHDVVAPTLRLFSGRAGMEGAERAFQDALSEISRGKPADAITDAGTALQEVLVALGCEGNALGPLIKSAKAKGLLASHDSTMTDGIEKLLHWVSADRSQTGDAHAATTPGIEDAWLSVHVVGALALRLATGQGRGAPS